VAEYAVKSFLEEWNVDPEDWVPVDLLKKIIDAQVAANKKISEALKKKKELRSKERGDSPGRGAEEDQRFAQ